MDAQYYLIGTDGRHHGPLSIDQVRTWIADGLANRYSRARRDTESEWRALRDMPEFEAETRPPHLGSGTASIVDTTGDLDTAPVADPPPSSGLLDPIACYRRAWSLISRDFTVLAGWTVLVSAVIVTTLLVKNPAAELIVGLVVNNLLMSGLYVLYLARIRGERPTLNDVASTVWASALTIVVAGLAQSALTALGLVLLIIPGIYLAVGYLFVLPLVVDKRLPVWEAMELSRRTVHRQWFQAFGLLLAGGIMLFLSALAFGIGLVITLPLCTAALMFAYEDLFGGNS